MDEKFFSEFINVIECGTRETDKTYQQLSRKICEAGDRWHLSSWQEKVNLPPENRLRQNEKTGFR